MAAKCEYCEKTRHYGHKVSHSKRRANRTWKVNLHSRRVEVDGRGRRAKLCTNCIKLLSKRQREGKGDSRFVLSVHMPESSEPAVSAE